MTTPSNSPSTTFEDLLDAANEAAKREGTQWFFLVTLMVYLAVAVGSVTHRKLFLEEPVPLPIFNVPMPLTGFFVVAPAIFVLLHFYVLTQISVMARKVEAALTEAAPAGVSQQDARLRLDPFPVAQMLAGGRSLALTATAWCTLIIAPVLLLLFFQVRFLPYHDASVTWWHRVLLLVDLVLIWWLWPRRRHGRRRWPTRIVATICTAAVVFFSTILATVPDEAIDHAALRIPGSVRPYSTAVTRDPLLVFVDRVLGRAAPTDDASQLPWIEAPEESWAAALRRGLFTGSFDKRLQWSSLFVNALVLPNERFVPARDEDFRDVSETLVLRGRDLSWARLDRADLRKADLSGADLRGAVLQHARLEQANLSNANLEESILFDAQLQGATLDRTSLYRAKLSGARLTGASLVGADLRSALLEQTVLDAATLDRAAMGAADLSQARMRAASLRWADLTDAVLTGAVFVGAMLDDANLTGAHVTGIDAVGASRVGTHGSASTPGEAPTPRALATHLLSLACLPDDQPFAARGVIRNVLAWDSAKVDREHVAHHLRAPSECPGAANLKPSDLRDLPPQPARGLR